MDTEQSNDGADVDRIDDAAEGASNCEPVTEEEVNGILREQSNHRTRDYEEMPRFYTLSELEELCQQGPPSYLVERLLPADDVHVVVGDSGIGKTAWAYQLGLCVASGKPFLGHHVRQTPVVYYDMENGRQQVLDLARGLCRHLEIEPFPSDFRVFVLNTRSCAITPALSSLIRYAHLNHMRKWTIPGWRGSSKLYGLKPVSIRLLSCRPFSSRHDPPVHYRLLVFSTG